MKKISGLLILGIIIISSLQNAFALEYNAYEQFVDKYFFALVSKDVETAYSMVEPYSIGNENNKKLLISEVDEFQSLMSESNISSYSIIKTVQKQNGAQVEVCVIEDNNKYITNINVNNSSNGYKIDLANSQIISQDQLLHNNDIIIKAVPFNCSTIKNRKSETLDTYKFEYLYGNIEGLDTFDISKGDIITISGEQYDDLYPNRQLNIKVRYQIRAPKIFGYYTLVNFQTQGNGQVYASDFGMNDYYKNCYIYISNTTGYEYSRVKGAGTIIAS